MDRVEKYIDSLIKNSTPDFPAWNIEKKIQGIKSGWNYIDGCMIKAVLEMYEITGEKKYLEFAESFIDPKIDEDGIIQGFNTEDKNLDNINEGKVLFTLYGLTGKEKYRRAIEFVYSQVRTMPRTEEGSFWHKKIYPNQVWLDGLYMALPFYMEYESKYNRRLNYKDIFNQFRLVRMRMKDSKTGLYYHGYDSTKSIFWANPNTGLSANFWLRAIGWFGMALLDTLEKCEEHESEDYIFVRNMFVDLMDAMCFFQEENGMWYQVVNLGGRDGNYLETSGSAIMAYALLKGFRLGYLTQRHQKAGVRAFEGIVKNRLKCEEDELHLTGICLVAGLGGKDRRDGSFEYYMSEPIVSDDAKGVGPFLLAYTEMRKASMYRDDLI